MASLRSTVLLTYFFSGSISLDGAFPIIWFSSDLTTMDHAIVYALLFYWAQDRKVLNLVLVGLIVIVWLLLSQNSELTFLIQGPNIETDKISQIRLFTSTTYRFLNTRKYSDNLGTCHTLFEKSKTEGKVSESTHRRRNGESALRPFADCFWVKLGVILTYG